MMDIKHESWDILKEFVFGLGIRDLDKSTAKQEPAIPTSRPARGCGVMGSKEISPVNISCNFYPQHYVTLEITIISIPHCPESLKNQVDILLSASSPSSSR